MDPIKPYESYAEVRARIARSLAILRLRLFDLALQVERLAPVASSGPGWTSKTRHPQTPAQRAARKAGEAAWAEREAAKGQQKKLKKKFQALWEDLGDAVDDERGDMGMPFYLPYDALDFDYDLEAYTRGLEALEREIAARYYQDPTNARLQTLYDQLGRILDHPKKERAYVAELYQQPAIVPEEY